MKKFYVVGNNVSKSLSPTIFNYWFKKYKIKASYKYLQLNKNNFDSKVKEVLKDKRTKGLNITIPFKVKIIKHLDQLDNHSKNINAVNCLLNGRMKKGINTDWVGYYNALPKGYKLRNKKILLVGYGGAAQAIHYMLVRKGVKNLIIFNRTKKKISFEKKTKFTLSLRSINEHLSNSDLIINTTPTNPIKKEILKKVNRRALLSDIVYNPKETSFLKLFPESKKIYGINMLLQQAVPCFKFWFGFTPSINKELVRILDKKIT